MSLLNIPGYKSTFKNRISGRGGGVALFLRNCFKYTVCDDLSAFNNDYFESIFIELTNTILGNRIIVAVYRPPGYSTDLFMSGFVMVLSAISKTRSECLVAGHFNVEHFKYDENAVTEDFINNLYEPLFIPFISRPIRFNINSSTLIDNILSNKPLNSLVSGILITDVSDHFPVFYISKHMNHRNKKIAIKRETLITSDKNSNI